MSKVTKDELAERMQLPLEEKIEWAVQKILDYYLHYKGQVYLTFSGGKDSQIVMEIINRMYSGEYNKYFKEIPFEYGLTTQTCFKYGKIPIVFSDTGLEKPEIRRHALSFEGVERLVPDRKFKDVVVNEGVALGSKRHARSIREINFDHTPRNLTTRTFTLTGIMPSGKKTQAKIPSRYYHLIDKEKVRQLIKDNKNSDKCNPAIDNLNPDDFGEAPKFKISDKCCKYFKKDPFHKYEKETGRKPITGTMAIESNQRRFAYLKSGCNTFDKEGSAMSRPISIWTPRDVWDFHDRDKNVKFAECYYDKDFEYRGQAVRVNGSEREGCMFCLFGVEQEEERKNRGDLKFNRFEKLAVTHPRQHEFLIKQLGFDEILDSIGVSHTPETTHTVDSLKQAIYNEGFGNLGLSEDQYKKTVELLNSGKWGFSDMIKTLKAIKDT